MKTRTVLTLFSALTFLTGCDNPGPTGCSPGITPSVNSAKYPHPTKPTSCMLVLQLHNYCEYNAEGMFKKVSQEVSGICIGLSMP